MHDDTRRICKCCRYVIIPLEMSVTKKTVWIVLVIGGTIFILLVASNKGMENACQNAASYNLCQNMLNVIGGAFIFAVPAFIIYNIWKS
jgi:hypothetical protein